jgi:hypothetical protein
MRAIMTAGVRIEVRFTTPAHFERVIHLVNLAIGEL